MEYINVNFLRSVMVLKNKTPKDVEKLLNISYNTALKKINGKSQFTSSEARRLYLDFGMSIDDFKNIFL